MVSGVHGEARRPFFNIAPPDGHWRVVTMQPSRSLGHSGVLGFIWTRQHYHPRVGANYRLIAVPWWFLTLLVAIWAAWHVRIFLARRVAHRCVGADLYPQCGYDTRASNVRCPECGHELAAAPCLPNQGPA